MYVRLSLMRLGPGRREQSVKLSEHLRRVLAEQPGFKEIRFFVDVSAGEWGCLSYWETREQAGEVRDALSRAMREALAGVDTLEREPNERIMEVLEP
jgi:heme-degrading monooxygenase HmoA